MTSTVIGNGVTLTIPVVMGGIDDLTVQFGGALSVDFNDPAAVLFTGPTNGAVINNFGFITATGAATAGIDFSNQATALFATINNSGNLTAQADAIVLSDLGSVTSGLVSIVNIGSIVGSAGGLGTGNAIDFGNAFGSFRLDIDNGGNIYGFNDHAIVIGGTGDVTNGFSIIGGVSGAYFAADGIVYGVGASGTVTNDAGLIEGDRNGISAGIGSAISVVVNSGHITGFGGAGIYSQGGVTVTNHSEINGQASNGLDTGGPTGVPDGIIDVDSAGIRAFGLTSVDNYGSINGYAASGHGPNNQAYVAEGIYAGGGSITNRSTGAIFGQDIGILIAGDAGTDALFQTSIVNAGAISGTTSYGIRFIGALDDTVTNSGTISGASTAIQFGSGTNTLFIQNGSMISGLSDGGDGYDLLNYSGYTASGVTVDLVSGVATGTGGIAGFEDMTGTAGADILRANGEANYITGGLGADTLEGRDGGDAFFVAQGDIVAGETIDGGAGSDTIVVTGGGSYDIDFGLASLASIERIEGDDPGETGTALMRFRSSQIGVGLDSHATLHGYGGDTAIDMLNITMDSASVDLSGLNLQGFDNPFDGVIVNGLAASETALGSTARDTMFMGNGADTVLGRGGADALYGEGGNDTLLGEDGDDLLAGGVGADTIVGGVGVDTVTYEASINGVTVDLFAAAAAGGDAAGDTIVGVENLIGSQAADSLAGNAAINRLDGQDGADTLSASGNGDTLIGGDGGDTYDLGGFVATIQELGSASDTDTARSIITRSLAVGGLVNVENLTLLGSGAISGTGNALANTITGNAAANVLNGGVDNLVDTLIGGRGNDTYVLGASTNDVVVETDGNAGGIDTVTSTVSRSLAASGLTSVENLVLVNGSPANGTGNALANTITGNTSGNTLNGGVDDLVDTLIGGLGSDTYELGASANDIVVETGGNSGGIDTVRSIISRSLAAGGLVNVENLELIGPGDADGTGNAMANKITGNGFANVLDGGVDSVVDTLMGGFGNDTYVLGSGNDTVVESSGTAGGIDTVTSLVTRSLVGSGLGNVENLTLLGNGPANGTGNALANTIIGNGGVNVIDGGALNDTLSGNGGNDIFLLASFADYGGDRIDGGTGADVIRFTSTTAGQTLTLNSFVTLVEEVRLSSAAGVTTGTTALNINATNVAAAINLVGNNGSNLLTGGAGVNTITGNLGDDTISGLAGNDILIGGGGRDTMTGGANDDTIRFLAPADSTTVPATMDVITDFDDSGNDTIDLQAVYGGVLTYISDAAFTAAGQVRVSAVGADVIVEVNTVGASGSEMSIRLANTTFVSMTGTDFQL